MTKKGRTNNTVIPFKVTEEDLKPFMKWAVIPPERVPQLLISKEGMPLYLRFLRQNDSSLTKAACDDLLHRLRNRIGVNEVNLDPNI